MRKLVCIVGLVLAQPVFAQQVTITSPVDGSTHYLSTTIQVRVDCQNSSRVGKVDLYVDGVLHGTDNAEPYRWTLNTGSTNQWRTLRAVADYTSGATVQDLIQVQVAGVAPPPLPTAITYVGVDKDVTDFQNGVNYGRAGYWFPQFNASSARSGKPTEENERNGLPSWAGPMTHMLIWQVWKFPQRTFSQDGPVESKGGWPSWNFFTLPNGDFGLSGIIFDPHGAANTSQTVNRINLGPGTPSSFYLRIVVDNTDLRHDPINRIRARGDQGGVSIDPPTYPSPGPGEFNGIADVYTFRYDGFADGDFIKIQFNGMPGSTNNGGSGGSSFAGLMFDLVPNPQPQPSPQPTPSPQPQPSPAPTGTTRPATTSASSAPAVIPPKSSGSGCAISPQPEARGSTFVWLFLAAWLILRERKRLANSP